MRKLLDNLYKASGALGAMSLVLIVIVVFGQVLFNIINYLSKAIFDIDPGLLIPSYASLSGYALAFATFLSLGLGIRQASHIRVTLLESHVPESVRHILLMIISIIGVACTALFVYALGGISFESFTWHDTSNGLLKIPLWIPQGIMFIGALVMFIAMLDTCIEVFRGRKSDTFRDDAVTGDD